MNTEYNTEYTRGGLHTSDLNVNEALRRKERLNVKSKDLRKAINNKNAHLQLLSDFIFRQVKMSPKEYITIIQTMYSNENNFRQRRQRNVDYAQGRQLGDLVYDPTTGTHVTQETYLRRRDIPPLQFNIISKTVRSLTGQLRDSNTGNVVSSPNRSARPAKIIDILNKVLLNIKNKNLCTEQDAENFIEMLLSEQPVFKVVWGNDNHANITKNYIKSRVINRADFVINSGISTYDLRGLHTCVEIHNTDIEELLGAFSAGDPYRDERIRAEYYANYGNIENAESLGTQSFDGTEKKFQTVAEGYNSRHNCRYYEVWKKIGALEAVTLDPLEVNPQRVAHKWLDPSIIHKQVIEENNRRIKSASSQFEQKDYLIHYETTHVSRWYVMFLTPQGTVLDIRESPYKNSGHPYVITPLGINGEARGLVEDLIDPQNGLNRTIAISDQININAAKGVWLIPNTAIPDTMSKQEYIHQMKSSGGHVVYNADVASMQPYKPEQVYANPANISAIINSTISMYAGLPDDISGNYGAAQGKGGSSTATGYALETKNANLNVKHIMDKYLAVLQKRDEAMLNLIKERYTKEDYAYLLGEDLDPIELTQYDFNIAKNEGVTSSAYAQQMEQEMIQLTMNFPDIFPPEALLETSTNPKFRQWAQAIESIKVKQQEEMAQQQQVPQAPPPQE